jgi:hypothetical protein
MLVYLPKMITINLEEYPLFSKLPDAERYIRSILDQNHSILEAQQTSLLSYQCSAIVDKVIETCQDSLEPVFDQLSHATSKISDYSDKLPCLEKSTIKGNVFENEIESFLLENLSSQEYSVESVSKVKHSVDFLISNKVIDIMFDSKHYKASVPTKELDKLKEDMYARKIRCGMLVSYESKIAKHKTIDMELYTDKVGSVCCILVLGNVRRMPNVIIEGIYYLEMIFTKVLLNTSYLQEKKNDEFISELEKTFERISELTEMFEEHKECVEKSLRRFERQLHEMLIVLREKNRNGAKASA